MQRRTFNQWLSAMSLSPMLAQSKTQQLLSALQHFADTPPMPALFLGHGSPMNAITDTEFGRGFQALAKNLPRPNAVLCISAHWLSDGSLLTAMTKPKTIHDFHGFPPTLHAFQYPADGSPALATTTQTLFTEAGFQAGLDHHEWGFDHGTWSVLTHLFPHADVPVVQLSLDYFKTAQQHYDLAKQLQALRRKGVLIVGSGNVVHNLGKTINSGDDYFGFDWALEADSKIKGFIRTGDHKALINFEKHGAAFALSIPTPEHYLPLLYVLSQQEKSDSVRIFNDKPVSGAITMTSVAIGV